MFCCRRCVIVEQLECRYKSGLHKTIVASSPNRESEEVYTRPLCREDRLGLDYTLLCYADLVYFNLCRTILEKTEGIADSEREIERIFSGATGAAMSSIERGEHLNDVCLEFFEEERDHAARASGYT